MIPMPLRASSLTCWSTRIWFPKSRFAVGGMIGWIGLVIPHLARMLAGPNCRDLIPTSFLVGSCFLLFVDNLARLFFTSEIPLGILTSLIGAPFFVYLLFRRRKGWV